MLALTWHDRPSMKRLLALAIALAPALSLALIVAAAGTLGCATTTSIAVVHELTPCAGLDWDHCAVATQCRHERAWEPSGDEIFACAERGLRAQPASVAAR